MSPGDRGRRAEEILQRTWLDQNGVPLDRGQHVCCGSRTRPRHLEDKAGWREGRPVVLRVAERPKRNPSGLSITEQVLIEEGLGERGRDP